jgi:DNA-binding transcriptional ArsR family regulator
MDPTEETADAADAERPSGALETLVDALATSGSPPTERLFDAITVTLVDTLLTHDQRTLSGTGDSLRTIQGRWLPRAESDPAWALALGRLSSLIGVAFAGGERVPSERVVARVPPRSRGHRLLRALEDGVTRPTDAIVNATGLSPSAVSHAARPLLADGLLTRTQVGKSAYWDITPHGLAALEAAGTADGGGPHTPDASPASSFDGDLVVDVMTWESPEREPVLTPGISVRPEIRSRVRCRDLMLNHYGDFTNRLLSWDSLGRFAADACVQYAVEPMNATASSRQRSLANILEHACPDRPIPDFASFWPIALPAFDAYALIRGDDDQRGVVLVEAKSQPSEFLAGKVQVKRRDRRDRLQAALSLTSEELGATRRWKAWPRFSDPTGRLALLYFLRANDIPAWLYNLYFVPGDPAEDAHALTASDWWDTIEEVRRDLAIRDGHNLSDYVTHGFVEAPAAL